MVKKVNNDTVDIVLKEIFGDPSIYISQYYWENIEYELPMWKRIHVTRFRIVLNFISGFGEESLKYNPVLLGVSSHTSDCVATLAIAIRNIYPLMRSMNVFGERRLILLPYQLRLILPEISNKFYLINVREGPPLPIIRVKPLLNSPSVMEKYTVKKIKHK